MSALTLGSALALGFVQHGAPNRSGALHHLHTITGVARIPANSNALSIAPITIAQGALVYVGQGTVWRFFDPVTSVIA